MRSLTDANEFPMVGSILHNKNCFTFQSKEEVYTFLEKEILNGMDIDKFCKVYMY